mmetsp:Transcript_39917/g.93704  ORF Transcript_39917/g.93704 Transcript_39917/m.93704 type:complete len:124 (-) Transcript_39917:1464-1835(-)
MKRTIIPNGISAKMHGSFEISKMKVDKLTNRTAKNYVSCMLNLFYKNMIYFKNAFSKTTAGSRPLKNKRLKFGTAMYCSIDASPGMHLSFSKSVRRPHRSWTQNVPRVIARRDEMLLHGLEPG